MPRRPSLTLVFLLPTLVFAQGRGPVAVPTDAFALEAAETLIYHAVEDDHGGFYLAWSRDLQNGQFAIVADHIQTDDSLGWPSHTMLVKNLQGNPAWDAFPDGQGGLIVTWIEVDRMRAQRFNAAAKPQWPEESTLVTVSSAPQAGPVGVADTSGGAFLIWSEKPVPERWVLMGQHLRANGKRAWKAPGVRVSLRPSEQRWPRVVADDQGGAVVAWHDFREGASQLEAQRVDFQGNRLWGLEGALVTAPAGDPKNPPMLAPAGGGGAAVAWMNNDPSVTRFAVQIIGGDGKFRWPANGVPISNGQWNQWNPVLYGDGRSRVWVAWEDYRDQVRWQAFLQTIDTKGPMPQILKEQALAPAYADQGQIALADDGHQGVFAVWVDNRSGGPAVYAQEVDAKGRTLHGGQAIVLSKQLINPARPQIVTVAPGQAVAAWADRLKKGQWALYWKRIPAASARR